MELHLMREDPENSGKYVDTGTVYENVKAADEGVKQVAAEQPGRYAIRIYESVRSDAQLAADAAATQEASGATTQQTSTAGATAGGAPAAAVPAATAQPAPAAAQPAPAAPPAAPPAPPA